MSKAINIQKRCAELGFALVRESIAYKELENMLRKALGILRENGIYSFFLWLEEKGAGNLEKDAGKVSEQSLARTIFRDCLLLVDDLGFTPKGKEPFAKVCQDELKRTEQWKNAIEHYTDIFIKRESFTPDDLFMLCELFAQFLTFSLYKAKAGGKNG